MQTINLDLSVRSVVSLLHAKQGDVGRKFKAVLTDNRVAYLVPPGAAVSVWYSGASGAGNYTDIGAESAVSVSGNEITVELIAQMLNNPGAGVVCLVLSTAGGDELGMWNINYCVEPRPGMNSVAAQEYYTAFSQAVANLPYPDSSLSVAGKAADAKAVGDALDQKQPKGTYLDMTDKTLLLSGAAADAKAVGDALAGKAPAGHGYGDPMTYYDIQDGTFEAVLDEILSGMESTSAKQIQFYDTVGLNANKYIGNLWKYTPDYATLEAVTYTGLKAIKRKSGGTWNPWEWENPPMVPGVEYRTTEQWDGKVVYKKVVQFGALPNNTEKSAVLLDPNLRIISQEGFAIGSSYTIPLLGHRNVVSMGVTTATGNVWLSTNSDMSAYTGYFVFKYCK